MRCSLGKADAIDPRKQAHKMLRSALCLNRSDGFPCFGRHNLRELQTLATFREKLNELILEVQHLQSLLRVGNLEDEPFGAVGRIRGAYASISVREGR